jgi:hypothetical protein
MPSLGTLLLKGNILAVKFHDSLTDNVKLNPNKLSMTKKHMNLTSDLFGSNGVLKELPEVEANLNNLRPNTYV